MKLDLGCGNRKAVGFTGLDIRPLPGVDIVHDLVAIPWPVESGSVISIRAYHVVEHLSSLFAFMDEAWRVLAPPSPSDPEQGTLTNSAHRPNISNEMLGTITIDTPYAGSHGYWQDPTHLHGYNEDTWLYFTPCDNKVAGGLYQIYKPKPWDIVTLEFDPKSTMRAVLRKRLTDRC